MPEADPRSITDAPTAVSMALGIAAAIAAVSAVGIAIGLSFPLLSFALEDRGASGLFIGLNTATAGLAAVLLAGRVPAVAAVVGFRRLLLSAIVVGAAAFVGFFLAGPLWLWFPLRFVLGAAITVLFVLSEFWILESAPPRRRGLVMGFYATSLSIGFALGPLLLAAIGTAGPLPYVAGAALMLAAAVPIALAGALAPRVERSRPGSLLGFLRAAPTAILAALVFGAVENGSMALLPVWGARLGYGETGGALLLSLVGLGNIVTQIPLGWLSDRVDRRLLLFAIGGLGAVGAASLPLLADHPLLLQTVLFVWGGIVAGLYTIGLAHLGARYAGASLAKASAAFLVCYSLGTLGGPALMGAGLDLWDPHGLAVVAALLLGAYAALAGLRLRRAGP